MPGSRRRSRNTKKKSRTVQKPGDRRGRIGKAGTDHTARSPIKPSPRQTRDLLGYKTMLPSGIAWLGVDEWSMTMRISDINYVAAGQDQQESLLDRWARFLNSFGAGSRIQLTTVNRVLADEDVARLLHKTPTGDPLTDKYRRDFNNIVRQKLTEAAGNTVTDKYLTVTVQEPDQEKAEATLTRVGHEVVASLQGLDGCRAERLSRTERLRTIAQILRPHELFTFREEEFTADKRLATHDFVSPWAVEVVNKKGPVVLHNGIDETFHTVVWVRDYPAWLSDRLITELTEIKCDLTVSFHLEPYDQVDGLGLVERQIAEMEMQTINERKKAKKQGIGEDMIPQKLVDALDEARSFRKELSTSNQKVFSSLLLVGVSSTTREGLELNVARVMTALRKQSVTAEVLKYMQLDGLTTELPVGRRVVPMRRTLTTSSAAIVVPFTTQELFVNGGVWYGVNASSSNALVADRTKNANGNGFLLGTSGSGKSQAGKMEISNIFLDRPDDDIIIIDPDREYEPVVTAFGGTVVRIHAGSDDRVNPLDLDLQVQTSDEDPILAKAGRVLSMMETLIGGRSGLTPSQRSRIDQVMTQLYRRYAAGAVAMPTLRDLRDGLAEGGDPDGAYLAGALDLYTSGSLSGFSNQTSVDANARIVSWDISKLGAEMQTFGMMVILDQIWTRVARNRAAGRRTWLYVDEFHLLFANRHSAEEFRALYARARKWGLNVTGVTQNVEAVLGNEAARLMLANSEFLLLLGQNPTDADALCQLLHFSEKQRESFTNVLPGQGLLKSGRSVIPFDARIAKTSELYKLFDTSFEDQASNHG